MDCIWVNLKNVGPPFFKIIPEQTKEQLNDPNVLVTPQCSNDGDVSAMMEEILRKWEIVKETNTTERPPTPKFKHTRQAK